MIRDDIARFQAKWQLGFTPADRVPTVATQMLEAGIQVPAKTRAIFGWTPNVY